VEKVSCGEVFVSKLPAELVDALSWAHSIFSINLRSLVYEI